MGQQVQMDAMPPHRAPPAFIRFLPTFRRARNILLSQAFLSRGNLVFSCFTRSPLIPPFTSLTITRWSLLLLRVRNSKFGASFNFLVTGMRLTLVGDSSCWICEEVMWRSNRLGSLSMKISARGAMAVPRVRDFL